MAIQPCAPHPFRRICVAHVLALGGAAVNAQIIDTIAGGGIADGSSATNAPVNTPQRVTTDSAGNLYISDTGNHRIRKVTAGTGVISTVAGNGTQGFSGDGLAAGASLKEPHRRGVRQRGQSLHRRPGEPPPPQR
jgi:hypothetical protein